MHHSAQCCGRVWASTRVMGTVGGDTGRGMQGHFKIRLKSLDNENALVLLFKTLCEHYSRKGVGNITYLFRAIVNKSAECIERAADTYGNL
jgi:hypothetical protein